MVNWIYPRTHTGVFCLNANLPTIDALIRFPSITLLLLEFDQVS